MRTGWLLRTKMRENISMKVAERDRWSCWVIGIWGLFLITIGSAYAKDQSRMSCMANGVPIAVNNEQVLEWKKNTPNQFRERGHVSGVVARLFPNKNHHNHFEIQIGSSPKEGLEVVYNMDFGPLPAVQIGMKVEACGDYITSTDQAGPYPPSPSGAIIHWVHVNPSGRGHDSGYLMIDGVLYGQDESQARRRRDFDEQNASYFYSEYP